MEESISLIQVREEEEWAAREEARRLEVDGLKAELEAVKRVAEGSGGVDGKLSTFLSKVDGIQSLSLGLSCSR